MARCLHAFPVHSPTVMHHLKAETQADSESSLSRGPPLPKFYCK